MDSRNSAIKPISNFHAETNLQFLDAVLGSLPALVIPDQGRFGRFDTVADDDVVLRCIMEQFGLAPVLDDDQAECPCRALSAWYATALRG